ncbi:MAG: carbon storage regulator [Planctomycetaceae bacterium]|nr:carbon storage regulator [Planctomycetaceae bacterium]
MLVLSRKPGEQIVLPNCNVNIVVLEVQGTRVRLGFDAPLEEPVYRAELWNRKLEAELRGSCDEILVEA